MRVFIELAYDGTRYHGWQRQPQSITVQEVLEDTLARLFGGPCPVMGCGRTDAGVHANYFVAHATLPAEAVQHRVTDLDEAVMKLNGMLPADIALFSMQEVSEKAHARFDAIERGYVYSIHTHKDPFLEGRSTRVYGEYDWDQMQRACNHLLAAKDFASFCKSGSDQGTTLCDVRVAEWKQVSQGHWHFHIVADRFLRNMVRAVVGTLLDVGRGKLDPDDVLNILEAHDRSAAGKSVLGCGLYLNRVVYPQDVFSPTRGA